LAAAAQPEETETWSPIPRVVGPGGYVAAPAPSDATILFDGTDLREWVSAKDRSPAEWDVAGGALTVRKGAGCIETRRRFMDYQLHLEWRVPEDITGSGQARGNSGLFLASTGEGYAGYELQILDSYDNPTYVNGQAGSIYKQFAPLVNAMRPPGEWQTYDVVWVAPRFDKDGSLISPATATVFHNGIVVQNHVTLAGQTLYRGEPFYRAHGPSPIKLQDHGDPVSFRNIWVRDLE
jgi:hypothetical protein